MFATLALLTSLAPTSYIAPQPGSLMLAEGEQPDCVRQHFLALAGGPHARVVVVGGKKPRTKAWEELGATDAIGLGISSASKLRDEDVLLALLAANGLWIEEIPKGCNDEPLFRALVSGVLERGGVVCGGRALAGAHLDDKDELVVGGLGLLPDGVVHFGHRMAKDEHLAKLLPPGTVGWGIEDETALVVHAGRRVGNVGEGDLTAIVAAANGWEQRRDVENAVDAYDAGDLPPYDFDLLSWRRSARLRLGPVAPSPEVAAPELQRGTVILHGGGGVTDEVFARFIAAAGGKQARYVCIPSASEVDPGDEPDSYSADELRERGCENVRVLHARHPRAADEDTGLLALLADADGVWIDGGRTYRMMDAYQGTKSHELLRAVLRNGGVVAGSSAGAQVIGDFLVRGNPRSNRTIEFEGYRQGLALLPGVVVDAHFLQRGRNDEFEELVGKYPQFLGIGVDEKTALVVTGHGAEVVGEHVVTFFDLSDGHNREELTAGDTYDLKARKEQ